MNAYLIELQSGDAAESFTDILKVFSEITVMVGNRDFEHSDIGLSTGGTKCTLLEQVQ